MAYARTVLCALGALFLTACASLEHRPLDSANPDPKDHGIRYYEMSPYLLVYSDGNGNIAHKILNLPDQTRLMSVTPSSLLAKLDSELVFENGTLKSSTATIDETTMAKAVISAIKTLGPMVLGLDGGREGGLPEYTYPAPHIYKIVADGDGITFYGAKGDPDVHVTIVKEQKAPAKEEGGDDDKDKDKDKEKKKEDGSGQ